MSAVLVALMNDDLQKDLANAQVNENHDVHVEVLLLCNDLIVVLD